MNIFEKQEIGLVYREGLTTKKETGPWIAGCAYFGKNRFICTDHQYNRALVVNIEDKKPAIEIHGLVSPRGVTALPSGGAVIAEPSARRITIIRDDCTIEQQIAFETMRPWHAALWGDSWLIVDIDQASVFLVQVDTLARTRIPTPYSLTKPRSAVPTNRNTYLLCDCWRHQVVEVTLDGKPIWSYGYLDRSSSSPGYLDGPEHAFRLQDGTTVISDTKNHRILQVSNSGEILHKWGGSGHIGSEPGCLWFPVAACAGPEQEIVVADAANSRLHQISGLKFDYTLWGKPDVSRCILYHPRSVEMQGNSYIIADTANNRVVNVTSSNEINWSMTSAVNTPLSWPRFACYIYGDLFICDSDNHRVVVCPEEESPYTLTLRGVEGRLANLHTIRLAGKYILITDTSRESSFLVDRSGNVIHTWGRECLSGTHSTYIPVSDLHDAYLASDGNIWLADTGNRRILCISPTGNVIHTIHELVTPKHNPMPPLVSPRSVQLVSGRLVADKLVPDDLLLVCDSGSHRVLLMDYTGAVWGMYGGKRGLAYDHLSQPRFARLQRDNILIVDYLNNRILDIPIHALISDFLQRHIY